MAADHKHVISISTTIFLILARHVALVVPDVKREQPTIVSIMPSLKNAFARNIS